MTSLGNIQSLQMPTPPAAPTLKSGATDGAAFKNMLVESFDKVNTMQQDAHHAVEGLMTGEDVNPAEVLTAVQKADIAFKMMMQVRNKLVAAYQEVQNIRV
jgi:flagellar hook-basal body complex protein FliE